MTRRTALFTVPAIAGLPVHRLVEQLPDGLIKPPVLHAGDTVGIISPSTQVTDPDKQQLAEQTLRYFGLKAKWAPHVRSHHAQGVATVAERVEDLHAMFADKSVNAVMCIRGGYAAGQLLADIDYSLIRSNPKIFVGYSDITALHLAIHRHAGLVTFHGPVLLSSFTPYTQDCFRRALFSTDALGTLSNPSEATTLRPTHSSRTLHPGSARGRLIGGNLSLITSLMGTPYEIDTDGRIFFTEDVGEEPYRIDRMLTQLRLAGKLQRAAGIVLGECKDCGPSLYDASFAWNMTLGEVFDDRLRGVNVPAFSGLTIGHTADQLTLPLGMMASLDATGTLTIEEGATTA